MAGISEKPVSPDTLLSIKKCAKTASKVLGIEPRSSTPSVIAAAVDRFVHQWQKGGRPDESVLAFDDAALVIGSLWGEAIVSRFKWHWAIVTFHAQGDTVLPAVVSPDRSLAIYPLHFLATCFADPGVDAAILRSYNLLKGSALVDVKLKPGGYFNVMDYAGQAVRRG